MPEAISMPQKRVLGDATNNPRGVLKSPNSTKKRKLDSAPSVRIDSSQNAQRKIIGSSQQQKSQFEEEVLEKLTQDISGLKDKNSEKDQQWERPPLGDFDETKENICFQQSDAEEGLMGGKTAVRMFGVTEVLPSSTLTSFLTNIQIDWTVCLSPRYWIPTLPLYCGTGKLHERGLHPLSRVLGEQARPTRANDDPLGTYNNERKYIWLSGKSKELVLEDYRDRSEVHKQSTERSGKQCPGLKLQEFMVKCRFRTSHLR